MKTEGWQRWEAVLPSHIQLRSVFIMCAHLQISVCANCISDAKIISNYAWEALMLQLQAWFSFSFRYVSDLFSKDFFDVFPLKMREIGYLS